jgi:hypothetical protein
MPGTKFFGMAFSIRGGFMRRTLLILLASVFTLAAADVSGKWTGTLTPDSGAEGPALLILEHKGESLTGTAGPDEGQRFDILNGKVSGDKITFETDSGKSVMKFELTLKGEEMAGQVSREREGQKQTAKLNVKRTK